MKTEIARRLNKVHDSIFGWVRTKMKKKMTANSKAAWFAALCQKWKRPVKAGSSLSFCKVDKIQVNSDFAQSIRSASSTNKTIFDHNIAAP